MTSTSHSLQKTFPKKKMLAEAATAIHSPHAGGAARMGRVWKPHPTGNREKTGEELLPGSPMRRRVTSHRAVEAQLFWGC